jgi:hypothetical protein
MIFEEVERLIPKKEVGVLDEPAGQGGVGIGEGDDGGEGAWAEAGEGGEASGAAAVEVQVAVSHASPVPGQGRVGVWRSGVEHGVQCGAQGVLLWCAGAG